MACGGTYVIEYDANGDPVCKPGSTLYNWIRREDAIHGPQKRASKGSHMIIEDIQPYKSTIDGTVISSRSQHRKHLRQHGCVEIGTENMKQAEKHFKRPGHRGEGDVKRDVIRAVNGRR